MACVTRAMAAFRGTHLQHVLLKKLQLTKKERTQQLSSLFEGFCGLVAGGGALIFKGRAIRASNLSPLL